MQNSEGETPLSLAAQIGWTDGAEMLLVAGRQSSISPISAARRR